jgi:hypothetical protein
MNLSLTEAGTNQSPYELRIYIYADVNVQQKQKIQSSDAISP